MAAITPIAPGICIALVLVTLLITWRARTRATGADGFYAAGGRISAPQNALAIAGDFLSAAGFLGTIGIFYVFGGDGMLYAVGSVAGWPVLLLLFGERLRNLGRFSYSDVLGYRLRGPAVRGLAAVTTLSICGTYLVAQMVAAGSLVQLLFGIPFNYAVALVGTLMTFYVAFGGMVATTWIQILKACLLLAAAGVAALLVAAHFEFSFDAIVGAAQAANPHPRHLLPDAVSAISLAISFALGPAGFPHVLMRVYTVKDAPTARRSLQYATGIIALFQLLVIVLGYAASSLVPRGSLSGGANMAAVLLARTVGGEWLMGFTAAVTFATILAVVSGLTLVSASAVSLDLYKHVWLRGAASERNEIAVSRLAALVIGVAVVLASILFQDQNVGVLATLPFAIASSASFPVLLLTLYWRGFTTRGALACGTTGLVVSILLLVGGPRIWVDVLGHARPLVPYEYPTLFSLAAALLMGYILSATDRSSRGGSERAAFPEQLRLSDGSAGRFTG